MRTVSILCDQRPWRMFAWAAPRIFRWGVQNRIRERSERKKNFCTPTFRGTFGGTSKQISV